MHRLSVGIHKFTLGAHSFERSIHTMDAKLGESKGRAGRSGTNEVDQSSRYTLQAQGCTLLLRGSRLSLLESCIWADQDASGVGAPPWERWRPRRPGGEKQPAHRLASSRSTPSQSSSWRSPAATISFRSSQRRFPSAVRGRYSG